MADAIAPNRKRSLQQVTINNDLNGALLIAKYQLQTRPAHAGSAPAYTVKNLPYPVRRIKNITHHSARPVRTPMDVLAGHCAKKHAAGPERPIALNPGKKHTAQKIFHRPLSMPMPPRIISGLKNFM
jgi:hypothetical protein